MKTRRRNGFTVFELLVTMGLGLILLAAAYTIYLSQHRGFERMEELTNVMQSSRMAADQVTRELRMAGFGVIVGETFSEAKKYSLTFKGDIDADIATVLAADATAGDEQISVNLNDERDHVEAGDYIFVNGGGNVEMIQVSDDADAVDLSGEPDTIKLSSALVNGYTASTTLVRTVEEVRYAVTFPGGDLKRNNVEVADRLQNFEFHYYGENDQEFEPDAVNGLTQIQRAAIRKIELRLQVGTTDGRGSRTFSQMVELRNMGTRPFKADTCKPNPPTGVQVTQSNTCERFTVHWIEPTANACDGSALTDLGGYKIYYGTSSGDYFIPPYNVSDETVNEYTVHDLRLNNNETYYVAMLAYDSSFNESTTTAETTFTLLDTTPPSPPETVSATAGVGSVTVTWSESESEDVKGYRLYRDTNAGFIAGEGTRIADEETLTAEQLSFTDEGLDACTVYYYKVSAVDCSNEGEASAEVFGDGDGPLSDQPDLNVTSTMPIESPATPPATVAPFQAIGRNESVDLMWVNPSDSDFAEVIVRYSTVGYPSSSGDGSEVGTFAGSAGATVSQTHTNLINGTTYYYSAFAVDRCGNIATRATAYAQPGGTAPVVEIISPASGTTIEDGTMIFWARAYDPDQAGIHEPPSMDQDNGAGIVLVHFYSQPVPSAYSFPHTEYSTEYCAFGGTSNPCSAGDVTTWCDGTYQLYAVALDDEGKLGTSPFVSVQIHNGGIYLDETYLAQVSGTYNNVVTYQIKNDSEANATLVSLKPTWDHQDALLTKVEIPLGTTVWQGSTPAHSGDTLSLNYGTQPTISDGSTKTVRLTFTRDYSTLSASASVGATEVSVQSTDPFAQGDTIYLVEGTTVEMAAVQSISTNRLLLTGELANSFSYGATVRHTAVADDVQMTNTALQMIFEYRKTLLSYSCMSDELAISFAAVPQISSVLQDKPNTDTVSSTTIGTVQVENYRSVPVHASVIDHAGVGIAGATLRYYIDAGLQTVAPSSGYATLAMAYNESESEWEATIPYQSNVRIWFYLTVEDANGGSSRSPASGAYNYDYVADTTAPACPLGIVATKVAKKEISLSWNASSEPDVVGYNIYRSADCGVYTKVYTRVTDIDLDTPGVQYVDDDNRMDADKYCYTYYITAVDQQGNEPGGCSVYTSNAGDCPCP